MTLNGVITVILRYYTECINFKANYVKLVEARPVYSLQQKCSQKNLVLLGNM